LLFWVLSYLLNTKLLTKVPSVLFYGEIRWTKQWFCPISHVTLKAKLRLEVLFKKFHHRINLATLFSTKSYLLNTVKPAMKAMKTVPWQNLKNLYKKVPLGTWTLKSWVCRASNWPKRLQKPKFQLFRTSKIYHDRSNKGNF
jgi:hypothetical protein